MQKSGYRADIDGLRALAILAVVAFHIGVPGSGGGFAGVDVFFVISGFLITSLLLQEASATGRVSLRDFYARRIRRLAPAYGLVVIATVAAGYALLLPTKEQTGLGAWAVSASAFLANLMGWREQAGYFAPSADYVPLMHLWTLAVEEQFYIVWPILILTLARISPSALRRRALFLFLFVGLVSVALSVAGERLLSTEAVFFLTPFRAWEFCFGAVIAAAPVKVAVNLRWGLAGCLAGAALILVFAVVAAGGAPLHWGWKMAPVAGAALLIVGGLLAPTNPITRLLGARPMTAVGRLSYSWYLWHWPLLSIARIMSGGDRNIARDSVLAFVAFGLAWATYRFLENPVRLHRPGLFRSVRGTYLAGAIILSTCAALGAGLWLWGQRPVHEPRILSVRGVERVTGHQRADLGAPADTSVMLWGDSHAEHLEPAVDALGSKLGIRILPRTLSGCRFDTPDPLYTGVVRPECVIFNRQVVASLPDLIKYRGLKGVIVAARWTESDYEAELTDRIRRLRALGLRVLIVEDDPLMIRSPALCYPRHPLPYCSLSRASVEASRPVARRTLRTVAAGDPQVRLFNLLDGICEGAICPPARDGVILYSDLHHLSRAGSLTIAPALESSLRWVAGENLPQLAN